MSQSGGLVRPALLAQTSLAVGGGTSALMPGQSSARSTSRRMASVSEIFGFWRFPQALARLSCSFENNRLLCSVLPSISRGDPLGAPFSLI
jgi:hypothetical protein